MTKYEGRIMPWVRDVEGVAVIGEEGHPVLDMDIVNLRESLAPGTKSYWITLVAFDEAVRSTTLNSDQSKGEVQERVRNEPTLRQQRSCKHHKRYVCDRQKLEAKKRKKDTDRARTSNYRANALLAGLETQQQNATVFHSFAAAYCSSNNQPPPPALNLPKLPAPPEIVVEGGEGFDEPNNDE